MRKGTRGWEEKDRNDDPGRVRRGILPFPLIMVSSQLYSLELQFVEDRKWLGDEPHFSPELPRTRDFFVPPINVGVCSGVLLKMCARQSLDNLVRHLVVTAASQIKRITRM